MRFIIMLPRLVGPLAAAVALVGAGVLLVHSTAKAANSVGLSPPLSAAAVGSTVSLDLILSFPGDPTLGGGVDIEYDATRLGYLYFNFDPAFPTDPAFTRLPDLISAGNLNSLGFGSFTGLSAGRVGTFTFTVLAEGAAQIVLLGDGRPGDAQVIAGPFYSALTFTPQQVAFAGAAVTAVPEPAAWLLSIAGLAALRLRMQACAKSNREEA